MSIFIIANNYGSVMRNGLSEVVVYTSKSKAETALAEFINEYREIVDMSEYSVQTCYIAKN